MHEMKSDRIYGPASALVSFLFLLPLLWYGFGADHGLFSYAVWVWRHFGQRPYIDVFDQAFPGIFIIHYLAQALLGESVTAFRVWDLAWQTATAIMIYLVAASIFRNRLAGFLGSALYAIYYLDLGPWHTGQRDDFFLLSYLLCLWLFRRKPDRREAAYSALAGFAAGVACLFKPVAAASGLVLLALAVKRARRKFLSALAFVAGAAAPSLAVVLYYWSQGGLRDLYLCLFYFTGKVYVSYRYFDLVKLVATIFMTKSLRFNLVIVLGALLLIPQRKKIVSGNKSSLRWFLLLLLASYIAYLVQGKYAYFFYYHEAPVLGLLCVLAGAGWALLIERLNQKWPAQRKIITPAISAMLILASIELMWPDYKGLLREALVLPPARGQDKYLYQKVCKDAADYIRSRSSPKDTVQVWGGEALINYFAQRRVPSRFPSTLQLTPFRPGRDAVAPLQEQFVRKLLQDMTKNPPLFFVVVRLSYFDNDDLLTALTEDYPELWEFVKNNYTHAADISSFNIYRKK